MDYLTAQLATSLCSARLRLGLSPDDVAERLAITPAYYARLEGGQTLPSLPLLVRMAKVLQVRVAFLVGSPELADDVSIC